MTAAFTGVSHVCPRCQRIVDPKPGNPSYMVGTTLQYEHPQPCPAAQAKEWNSAAKRFIQGSDR